MTRRFGVGIVGASTARGWAATAHIPAVRSIPELELRAVATTRRSSADAVATHFGIPLAFTNAEELASHPDVDIVAVTVKVPGHHDAVMAALDAAKAVYCEWPLALDSAEAERMLARARVRNARHLVGLQGRAQPEVNYMKDLLADGYAGKIVSAHMIVSHSQWGDVVDQANAYLFDRTNGATLLSIPGGHSIDVLCYCLGEFDEVSAIVDTRRPDAVVAGTGERLNKTSPDEISVAGRLKSGAVVSIHVRGGTAFGTPFVFEVLGTRGILTLSSAGSAQYGALQLRGADGKKGPEVLDLPQRYRNSTIDLPPGPACSVARLYCELRDSMAAGRAPTPGFEVALVHHRLLDAIQRSSDEGRRIQLKDDQR